MAKGKFMVLFLTLLLGIFTVAWATTISVPGDYLTLQEAVAVAMQNDVIHVYPGLYNTGAFIEINQQGLQIIGVDAGGNPITSANNVLATVGPYTGGEGARVFSILANNVTISGIRISDSNDKAMGVNGDNFIRPLHNHIRP